ncbi:MAG: hypothetical protein ABFC12_03635 [Methanobacterium sp.]
MPCFRIRWNVLWKNFEKSTALLFVSSTFVQDIFYVRHRWMALCF